jgi:hypothetical protein
MPFECNDAFEPIEVYQVPYSFIWLKPDEGIFAIVDLVDLEFARQWLWTAQASKSGPRRIEKFYATRTVSILTGGEGERSSNNPDRTRRSFRLWLHKEILLRAKGPPPSKSKTIGDHLNGNSLDCRRVNLKWSSASENRRNLFGSATHQLHLGFKRLEARHRTKPLMRDQVDAFD